MTTFAPHRDAVEFFVDCMHGGADKDALSGILAEDVVLYGPLGDEPFTGREAVLEAMRTVGTVAADLTYKEVLSGETHHAAYFRLQIEDTVVNGMDYILLDADGKIAEVTIWWRPLPSGVQMQGTLLVSSACSPGNFSPIWSNGEARSRGGQVVTAPDGPLSPTPPGPAISGRTRPPTPTSPTLATGPRVVRTLRSTLSEATIQSMRDADQPVRKVPSRDDAIPAAAHA